MKAVGSSNTIKPKAFFFISSFLPVDSLERLSRRAERSIPNSQKPPKGRFRTCSNLRGMQLKDPLPLLEKLPEEQYLLVYEPSGEESPEEQGAKHEEFRQSFGRALDRLAAMWGEPNFMGTWEDAEFPDWYDALLIACWDRPKGKGYLAYQWSGPEMPMLIALGLKV